jgi:hypothetical protein
MMLVPSSANAAPAAEPAPPAVQQVQQHQPASLTAGVLEAPAGRYCNINPPSGTVCLYGAHNAVGYSAHYGRCGNADVPSWLDPGNANNGGVSSYWDNQTGGAYLIGYSNNTEVFNTRNHGHTVNLVAGNDKAWWVKVC